MFERLPLRIDVFSKDGCPRCDDVRAFLTGKRVPFTEIKLNEDTDRQAFYDFWGLKGPGRTVPQVVIVDVDGERHRLGGASETKRSGIESLLMMGAW